ncbi:unnamed protein product [marine sediment metagenome]|uniref:MoaB/Mog domain-containing protein n=1 Tax=marine sediment metagenome TaxID=412755 RepID=X1DPV3_9ZZZZ
MIKVGILTISDKGSRGEREDLSGKVIKEVVKRINGEVRYYKIIPDEKNIIQEELIKAVDKLHLDLILTTGGTGLGKRDVTPEATLAIIEKEVPGISEIIRSEIIRNNIGEAISIKPEGHKLNNKFSNRDFFKMSKIGG